MQQNILETNVELTTLFPLYNFAVKEIVNVHQLSEGKRFHEIIIKLATNEKTKKYVEAFVKDVNQKFIKANNITYLKRFTEMYKNLL